MNNLYPIVFFILFSRYSTAITNLKTQELSSVFLGLGTNLGDKQGKLDQAIELITQQVGFLKKASSVYITEPWGIREQDQFLNQVIEVRTFLQPLEILQRVLDIEKQMGRKRVIKWGERIIDIDILFVGQLTTHSQRLKIPHPHLQDRNFVLVPMVEIAPDFIHPVFLKSMRDLLAECSDTLKVEPIFAQSIGFTDFGG